MKLMRSSKTVGHLSWVLGSMAMIALPLPAIAGSAPSGAGSGVNPHPGAPPITTPRGQTNTRNAFVDVNGRLQLYPESQTNLDAATAQALATLENSNPVAYGTLTASTLISLNTAYETPVSITVGGTPPETPQTPNDLAQLTFDQILAGQGLQISAEAGNLTFSTPATATGEQITTTISLVRANGLGSQEFILSGTADQVANAAAFIAAAGTSGLSDSQIQTGINLALAGVPYERVVNLVNQLAGLMELCPTEGNLEDETDCIPGEMITDVAALHRAIYAYNAILDDSDDATVLILSQDNDFVAVGNVLQSLRAAIDLQIGEGEP